MPPPNYDDGPSIEQQCYWQELVQLKIDCLYIHNYRNSLTRWVNGTAAIRAIASCGSIAAWAVWRQYSAVWGSIIALSQLMDALKGVFPFVKRRKALSGWLHHLESQFVLDQKNWQEIAAGRCSDDQIRKMLHKLRQSKQRLEARYIPDGLARKQNLFFAAEMEAERYFAARYASIDVLEEEDA